MNNSMQMEMSTLQQKQEEQKKQQDDEKEKARKAYLKKCVKLALL